MPGPGSYWIGDDERREVQDVLQSGYLILSRTINLSVGVVDAGLSAGFGININSTDAEIDRVATEFRTACEAVAAGRSRESTK